MSVSEVSVVTVCDVESTTASARIDARQESAKTSRVLFELASLIKEVYIRKKELIHRRERRERREDAEKT